MTLIGDTQAPPSGDLIKDGTDQSFVQDVIEASRATPVIVDFWATWCGPCRQLGPALEKAVLAAKGKVKLVKIDVDKNPAFAGQLRVQSIPAVFAFAGGRPVDAFTGALPESQVKQFVDRLAAAAAGQDPGLEQLFALAKESMDNGDVGGAAQAYAEVLRGDPENAKAIGGLARCYLLGGDPDRAREILEMAPEGAKDPEIDGVRAALSLAAAADNPELQAFERRLAQDPGDQEARFELAKALAGQGRYEAAVDHLLTLIEQDREWNDQAARKQLLTVFEAAGPMSDVSKQGRRRLSSILFS